MHTSKNEFHMFAPKVHESYNVNSFASNVKNKNFISGLQNARKLLEGLERSINKNAQYETRLLRCRSSHVHTHDELLCSSDRSEEKEQRNNKRDSTKTLGNHVNLTGSWCTISIVCLQYQYEELSKRYESLLQAFHERSSAVSERDAALALLRARVQESYAQLSHAHQILLSIGEKYLALWNKKQTLKRKYEKRIDHLKATIRGMMAMCEHARLELDNRILRFMEKEHLAPNAQLLAEIRKCNQLNLENLRLKARIEKLAPGMTFRGNH